MNGKFLDLRRFDPDRAGHFKSGNTNMADRSENSWGNTRRSSEPALPKPNESISLEGKRRHDNCLPIPGPDQDIQKVNNLRHNPVAGNNFEGDADHLRTPKTGNPPDESFQDHGRLKTVEGSPILSSGSPVKRKKWKRSNPQRPPKRMAMDSTELSPTQLPKIETEILKHGQHDHKLRASEAAAGHALQSKLHNENKRIESVKEADIDCSADFTKAPAQAQAQLLGEPQSLKEDLMPSVEDGIVDHSTGNRRSPTPHSTIQPRQIKRPLDPASEDLTTTVHLPHSSTVPGKPAVQSMEAISTEQTQPTATNSKLQTPQRDNMTDQGSNLQAPAVDEPYGESTETVDQKRVAEASQRKFATDFVQIQSMTNNSKQKGKSRHSRVFSKAAGQQSSVKPHVTENAVGADKIGKQPQQDKPKMADHPAVQHPQEQSLILRRSKAQELPASRPTLCENAYVGISSEVSYKDILPLPTSTSSSTTKAADTVSLMSSTTPPTTAHLTEQADTSEKSLFYVAADADPEGCQLNQKSSITYMGSASLRSKLQNAGPYTEETSQPIGSVTDHSDPIAHVDKSQQPEKQNNVGEKDRKERAPKKSNSMPEEPPPVEQQDPTSAASNVESLHMNDSDKPRLDLVNTGVENTGQPMHNRKVLAGKQESPGVKELWDAADMTNEASARQSPDRLERPAVPPRSSSIVRSPTPAPIMTRKKKQNRFAHVVREQEESAVTRLSDSGEKKEYDHGVHIITEEGTKAEKACDTSK